MKVILKHLILTALFGVTLLFFLAPPQQRPCSKEWKAIAEERQLTEKDANEIRLQMFWQKKKKAWEDKQSTERTK